MSGLLAQGLVIHFGCLSGHAGILQFQSPLREGLGAVASREGEGGSATEAGPHAPARGLGATGALTSAFGSLMQPAGSAPRLTSSVMRELSEPQLRFMCFSSRAFFALSFLVLSACSRAICCLSS